MNISLPNSPISLSFQTGAHLTKKEVEVEKKEVYVHCRPQLKCFCFCYLLISASVTVWCCLAEETRPRRL